MNNSIYLQLISLNKKHTEHYLRRYVKLISFYKERNWSYKSGLHEHHIIPKAFGGLDKKENLVFITTREHFILHHLLYKAFPKSKMVTAFKSMCFGWGHYSGNKVTSKVYQNAMLEFGKINSENAKKRVTNGTHHFLDKEKASQRIKKRVEDKTHNFCGSELQRKRVTEGTHHLLGKNQIKILCKHCNRYFSKGNYKQYHGDKCKLNPLFIDESKPKPKIECSYCHKEFCSNTFTQWHGDKCKLKLS